MPRDTKLIIESLRLAYDEYENQLEEERKSITEPRREEYGWGFSGIEWYYWEEIKREHLRDMTNSIIEKVFNHENLNKLQKSIRNEATKRAEDTAKAFEEEMYDT